MILPLTGPFDPTGSVAPVRINPAATVPTSANPTYYLDFRLAAGDPDIIFNHIPLDPFLTRNPLVVTKTSVKRNASVGDITKMAEELKIISDTKKQILDLYNSIKK